MSIGTATLTVALNQSERRAEMTGPVHRRELVTLTVTGITGATATNLVLVVFRGSTLVAACSAFTASGSNATGTIDLNTDELATVFSGVRSGAIREHDARVYDSSTQELMAEGRLAIRQSEHVYGTDTGTTPTAITGPTGQVGIETINGFQYFIFKRSDGTVFLAVPAPGAPPLP